MRVGTSYVRKSWRLPVALVATLGFVCASAAFTLWAQQAGNPPPSGEKFFDPSKVPFNTKVLRPDMKLDFPDWPKDSATGAAVRRISGPKAGLPAARLPGVRFLKAGETSRLDVARSKSGLYLVGIDYVPKDVTDALKRLNYTLRADGTLLDDRREPVVAFVTNETYLIEPPAGAAKSGAVWSPPSAGLLARLSDMLMPAVEAASPFAWRCYSFTPWAVYHGGFHRWYDARTWASAYGADGSGGCSWASPLTNISYIQTRAAVGWPGNENHCFNCNSEYSRDVWDVGYFWPAHGVPTTTHTGVWADGSFSFSRIAHLTW